MLEAFIVIFAVGFVIYYMIRHPLTTIKRLVQALGIFLLGLLGIGIFITLILLLVAAL